MIENLLEGLYVNRMIILIEDGPQSNEYRQLILTAKQFKDISDSIAKACGTVLIDGKEKVCIKESSQTYPLPDNVNDFY